MARTEKEFWVEMSIREITTQAHFADLAYKNINSELSHGTDIVFYSINSFLSHCANVSRLLRGSDEEEPPTIIGDILGVSRKSMIHNRRFRNHLNHYDERLKRWIRKVGINANIGTYNVGPKTMIQAPNFVFVSHYDADNKIFTFVDEDLNLSELYRELQRIKKIADDWVSLNT